MRIIKLWINGAAFPVTTPSELRNHVEGAPGADVEFDLTSHMMLNWPGSVYLTGGDPDVVYTINAYARPAPAGFRVVTGIT